MSCSLGFRVYASVITEKFNVSSLFFTHQHDHKHSHSLVKGIRIVFSSSLSLSSVTVDYPPSKTRQSRDFYHCNLRGNSCAYASHWCQSLQDHTWEAKDARKGKGNWEFPEQNFDTKIQIKRKNPERSLNAGCGHLPHPGRFPTGF